ncbi:hypothetical protein ACSBR1_004543 [Camellia fascicularis]
MPGGYNGNDGPNQGMAILTREAAFKAFMVTRDIIAMSLSISAVLIHFYVAITNNRDTLENQVYAAAYLIIYARVAIYLILCWTLDPEGGTFSKTPFIIIILVIIIYKL